MDPLPSTLKPFDLFPPSLQTFKDNLKTARKAIQDLEIQDTEIRHQLALDWDSLPLTPGPHHYRYNELATSHHEWYRDLRSIYRQRIAKLESEIAKETNYSNYRTWSQIELLLRWKSGMMDYSIFRDVSASRLVRASFELEAGLELPDEKTIMLVSAQVAAGWYRTPIESKDWGPRIFEEGFVDTDFPGGDEGSEGIVYVEGCRLRNTFVPGSEFFQPKTSRERNVERSNCDEKAERRVYKTEHSTWKDVDEEEPLSIETPQSRRSWAEKYPRKHYSETELQYLAFKANTPVKPKKLVNLIAGRTSTRRIVAEEYVD